MTTPADKRGGPRPNAGRKRQGENFYIYEHKSKYGYIIKKQVKGKCIYIGFAQTVEEARIKRDKWLSENRG